MSCKGAYTGIDLFKLIAAFLVLAIHTGPLDYYSEFADFLLTGVASRLAVPFFFMASGFFFFRKMTGDRAQDRKALYGFTRRMAWLYGISILIYIPLNLYTGYFTNEFSFLQLLKDIVFNGTFYHLWYLPALLLGVWITSIFYRRRSQAFMLVVAAVLYTVGLLGDSYFGLTEQIPAMRTVYGGMFEWFDYTRNGIFFAPIYLALGAMAAGKGIQRRDSAKWLLLFLVFLGLLMAEGIVLHEIGYPRHDSMYLFLVPAVYFLFRWLQLWAGRGAHYTRFRKISLWIYLLHPIAIVLVRGAAKAAHLESLFITNSLIHYTAVCILSVLLSIIAQKYMPRLF